MIYNTVMTNNEPINTIGQPIVNEDYYEPTLSIRDMFRAWRLVLGTRYTLDSSAEIAEDQTKSA